MLDLAPLRKTQAARQTSRKTSKTEKKTNIWHRQNLNMTRERLGLATPKKGQGW